MTPDQASDLAARTLAAIDGIDVSPLPDDPEPEHRAADRARVASDLAGLQEALHLDPYGPAEAQEGHLARYAAGLRRTAALYGIEP